MTRRWVIGPGLIVAIILVGVGMWWFNRPAPVPTTVPAGAPAIGSCWKVDAEAARAAMPWPGDAVDCAASHTAEVFHVGQVDRDLVRKARSATGNDATLDTNLMYGEARRACSALASTYLGSSWHTNQVSVLASWIAPTRDGFFACALVQVADPTDTVFVTRTASLKGAGGGALTVACVAKQPEGLRYVGCDAAHEEEFVGAYTVTPADAPFNAAAVKDTVTKGCAQAILGYLGLSATDSRTDLSVGYVGPTTASTWLGSDQTFGCYAMSATTVRGSIHGLGTRPLPH